MMTPGEFANWLSVAEEAVLKAGDYLLNPIKSSRDIKSSLGKDIKISADMKSESIILNFLKEKSDFSILSEESGIIKGKDQRFAWIIDPLDGSLNYSRAIPLCCISIGLWKGMDPILGVVYDFYSSELYTGIAGKGAWLNKGKIEVSQVNKKEDAVLCTGFPVNTDFSSEGLITFVQKVQEYKKIRLLGSAALSLAYVASGRADAYMENDIMIWDVAGGLAIARASGCEWSIRDGNKPNSFHVTVSNGKFDMN